MNSHSDTAIEERKDDCSISCLRVPSGHDVNTRAHWENRICDVVAFVMSEALLTESADAAAACLRALEKMGIEESSWTFPYCIRLRSIRALSRS